MRAARCDGTAFQWSLFIAGTGAVKFVITRDPMSTKSHVVQHEITDEARKLGMRSAVCVKC